MRLVTFVICAGHGTRGWRSAKGDSAVATAHLVVAEEAASQNVLEEARGVMRTKHHIEHATLQVEARATKACDESSW